MSVGSVVTPTERLAPFGEALVALGTERPDLVVLSADLSRYTDVLPFAEAFPERHVQVGMAEQNLMGIAGGLAKRGLLPVAVTYGVFATRRAYDQLAMALCTGASRGIVVAFLPGITTPFRATHQAVDDLALTRAIPGLTVVDPLDAVDLAGTVRAAAAAEGTVYIRGLRGKVPVLLPVDHQVRLGETVRLSTGTDVAVLGTGLGTAWALEAATLLEERGVSVDLLHVPTLKPADTDAIAAFCARHPVVTTVENHSVIGGLAAVTAEALAARGAGVRLHALGVPDAWAPAGTLEHIRHALGLDAEAIAESALAARREAR